VFHHVAEDYRRRIRVLEAEVEAMRIWAVVGWALAVIAVFSLVVVIVG